jgi:hypothetical protein
MGGEGAHYPQALVPRDKRFIEHVIERDVFVLRQCAKDVNGLQHLVRLPALALHKRQWLDCACLHGFGSSHGVLFRDGASAVALALQDGLADISTDLVVEGIDGVGEGGVFGDC